MPNKKNLLISLTLGLIVLIGSLLLTSNILPTKNQDYQDCQYFRDFGPTLNISDSSKQYELAFSFLYFGSEFELNPTDSNLSWSKEFDYTNLTNQDYRFKMDLFLEEGKRNLDISSLLFNANSRLKAKGNFAGFITQENNSAFQANNRNSRCLFSIYSNPVPKEGKYARAKLEFQYFEF